MLNAPGRIGQLGRPSARRPSWWSGNATAGQNETRRLLVKQIQRQGGVDAALSVAITFSSTSSGAAATLTGTAIARTDSKIKHYGGPNTQAPGSFPHTQLHYLPSRTWSDGTSRDGFGATRSFRVRAAQQFEIRWYNNDNPADFFVWIDGLKAAEFHNAPAGGGLPWIKINYSNLGAAADRDIRIQSYGAGRFGGLTLDTGSSLADAPLEYEDVRIWVGEDSFSEAYPGFTQRLGKRLGCLGPVQSAFGATGWDTTFTSGAEGGLIRPKFKDRLADLTTLCPCDVYVIGATINDAGANQSIYEAGFDTLRAARPNALFYILSTFNPSAPGGELGGNAAKDAALLAACQPRPGFRLLNIKDMEYEKVGGGDNTHPSVGTGDAQVGDYIARLIYRDLGLTPTF